jgi:gliding motility-associated-like protein
VDSIYTVRLVATSSDYNCSSETSKTVTVYPQPKADFKLLGNKFVSCPPFNVQILNQSLIGDTFLWTFGDETPSFKNYSLGLITHQYDNYTNDIYSPSLELLAITHHNCQASNSQTINVFPRVRADIEPDTSGCSPLLVPFRNLSILAEKYQWTFGDQGTSNIENPSNQYFNNTINDVTYTATLIGTSKYDCSDTAYSQILVYPQPEARFKVSPTYMEYPMSTVSIANQTKPGFWNFLWDFGDGTPTSTDKDPAPHKYSTWGETPPYTISLTAQSAHCAHTFTQPVAIRPPKPLPGFTTSLNGCVPWTIQFTDTSLWAKEVVWDFGDGGGVGKNPSHTYNTAGVYNVKLTVKGYKPGDEDFIYHQVIIYPKPEIQFSYAPSLVMLPDASDDPDSKKAWVQFKNMSKYATQFLWDFGDGTQSSEENPSHRYTAVGIYDVTLSGWSQNGCFDSLKKVPAIKVISPGHCNFPNAFTPNTSGPNDGKYKKDDRDNDVFHPFWDGVAEFNMEIYDRWGEKLFESNDINVGWNGYYKGKLCKADVYVFKAKGKYADGTDFSDVGDVTLIR